MKFDCVLIREGGGYSALCLDLDVAIENSRPYLRPVPKTEDPRTRHPDKIVEGFTL